jgi:hypothetical protein
MANVTVQNGWERLPNGFDVEFRHSIPIRVSDNGKNLTIAGPGLVEEIAALCRLRVQLGEWEPGERTDERAARVFVSGKDFAEVLRRLALSSAAMFIDRFHKPVEAGDGEWDRLDYLKDCREARDHGGRAWGDIDKDAHLDGYLETMHIETQRLAQSTDSPMVEPE